MYDKSLEPISAMMDGEIEEFELRRVIERTSKDKKLVDKWNRYHLAQDVMKGRSVQIPSDIDLVCRVSSALDNEPTYSSSALSEVTQKTSSKDSVVATQWWKPMASMAVAASVTAVVLLGAQQYNQEPIAGVSSEYASVTLGVDNFPQNKFGNELSTVSASSPVANNKAIKNAYGMEQYIQRHLDLAGKKAAHWQASWMPQGYELIDQRVTSLSEVMLFSNGKSAVSVNIEPLGAQVASQGMLNKGDLLALGVRADNKFITVVGAISAQEAQKIASSIKAVQD